MNEWAALSQWGDAQLLSKFETGAANDVRLVNLNGRQVVARLGQRTPEYLQWECDLLAGLQRAGLAVPAIIPTIDGRSNTDGIIVMEQVVGRNAESGNDWLAVAQYLKRMHEITRYCPQRPNAIATVDALTEMQGENIDLNVLSASDLQLCRSAWRRLSSSSKSVVHGDPNETNVIITEGGPVLIDWDEARVDYSIMDLAGLANNISDLSDREWSIARNAYLAWDASVCHTLLPEYSRDTMAALAARSIEIG